MATAPQALYELECITDPGQAAALLDPIRRRIMEEARQPVSATEIAARLHQPRQRVNYHVRELASAKLLRKAGQRRKRNMIERQYVTTAKSYLLAPSLLGQVSADTANVEDRFSAEYLMAATAKMQSDLVRASSEAAAQGKRLPTMTAHSEIRFESAQQRARFMEALGTALTDLIAKHTSPGQLAGGAPGPGRPYRLLVGCCPIPPDAKGE